ncbi:hypothetical protein LTR56_022190 [Elasticomyces elasticus]|nr:hypothetical protein LTR56_022190 [Elasticomyces elasticus]KAK3631097.1 hypothetical protein LTR22_021215 [Elasticomyces elasticus]KAK4909511.1 hypothetical protein LTR49_021731 [Elasticomyces elasticus]KAK5748758.1 hypothetical protein LTS12_021199 [Elasticomyces elasticus]
MIDDFFVNARTNESHSLHLVDVSLYQPSISSPLACHVTCATDIDYNPYAPSLRRPKVILHLGSRRRRRDTTPTPEHSVSVTSHPRHRSHSESGEDHFASGGLPFEREDSPPPEEDPLPPDLGAELQRLEENSHTPPAMTGNPNLDPRLAAPEFRSWPALAQAMPTTQNSVAPVQSPAQTLANARTTFIDGPAFAPHHIHRDERSSREQDNYRWDARSQSDGQPRDPSPSSDIQATPRTVLADSEHDEEVVARFVRKRGLDTDAVNHGHGTDSKTDDAPPTKKQRIAERADDDDEMVQASVDSTSQKPAEVETQKAGM